MAHHDLPAATRGMAIIVAVALVASVMAPLVIAAANLAA